MRHNNHAPDSTGSSQFFLKFSDSANVPHPSFMGGAFEYADMEREFQKYRVVVPSRRFSAEHNVRKII
jgi:hypothetical protein